MEVAERHREFMGNDVMAKAIDKITLWLIQPQSKRKSCLYLFGSPGTGKTTMVLAIRSLLNLLHRKDPTSSANEISELYLNIKTAKDISELYMTDKKSYRSVSSSFFLGIDDLGSEASEILSHGNIKSPIIDLLENRYITLFPTIITSNLTGDDIRERYGDRIADRLNEIALPISLDIDDLNSKQEERYFSYRNLR